MALLTVSDLVVEVDAPGVGWRPAVCGVGFHIERGEALGVVGESGCGKSLTALSLLGLLPEGGVQMTGGAIEFDGRALSPGEPRSFREVRGAGIGYVPQDPMTSLNPVISIGEQVSEAVRLHERLSRRGAREQSIELMKRVGIPAPAERYRAYPHELSGGQRQRVLIAIALAGDPALLVADEPTTALDVTVQAQVLRLLTRLRRDRAMALLLITHDLGVVAQTCDRVLILYGGRCVEAGPAREVLHEPKHPYTRGLLDSIPRGGRGRDRLQAIAGVVPGVGRWPDGCRFRDRCPRAEAVCAAGEPELSPQAPGREAACHFAGDFEGVAR